MKNDSRTKLQVWLLAVCGLIFLLIPLLGNVIELGGGTDDKAGELIQTVNPDYTTRPLWEGFEPSEAAEPWLFVLQVAIGIGLFVWAFRILMKQKNSKHDAR